MRSRHPTQTLHVLLVCGHVLEDLQADDPFEHPCGLQA